MGFSSFVVSPTGVSPLPLAPYEQDIFNCEEVQLCCRSHLIIWTQWASKAMAWQPWDACMEYHMQWLCLKLPVLGLSDHANRGASSFLWSRACSGTRAAAHWLQTLCGTASSRLIPSGTCSRWSVVIMTTVIFKENTVSQKLMSRVYCRQKVGRTSPGNVWNTNNFELGADRHIG